MNFGKCIICHSLLMATKEDPVYRCRSATCYAGRGAWPR